MMSLVVLVRLLFLSEVFSVVTFRGEPFNVFFFWGGGGRRGGRFDQCKNFPYIDKKKADTLFQSKSGA